MTDQRRIRMISEGVVASYIHEISSRATPPAPQARSSARAAPHTTARVRRPRRSRMRPSRTTVSSLAG